MFWISSTKIIGFRHDHCSHLSPIIIIIGTIKKEYVESEVREMSYG